MNYYLEHDIGDLLAPSASPAPLLPFTMPAQTRFQSARQGQRSTLRDRTVPSLQHAARELDPQTITSVGNLHGAVQQRGLFIKNLKMHQLIPR